MENLLDHEFINPSGVSRSLIGDMQSSRQALQSRRRRGKILMGDSRDDRFLTDLKALRDIIESIVLQIESK